MASTLEFLSVDDARVTVLRQLGFSDSTSVSMHAILAELVRVGLWMNVRDGEPVHRRRIISYGLAVANALGIESDPADLLSRTLDELESIGELARFPNGHFLPAPMRWVGAVGERRPLLIGGAPTFVLPEQIARTVEHRHLIRTAEVTSGLPLQPLDHWLDRPSNSIADWFEGVVEQLSSNIESYDREKLEKFEWNLYPGESREHLQFYRWSHAGKVSVLQDGPYLGRRRRRFSPNEFALIQVDRGRIRRMMLDASEIDLRRIQYALDYRYGIQTTVRTIREEHMTHFVLSNEVPRAEQRLLTALALRSESKEGRYYPRTWTLSASDLESVVEALGILGVRFDEVDG